MHIAAEGASRTSRSQCWHFERAGTPDFSPLQHRVGHIQAPSSASEEPCTCRDALPQAASRPDSSNLLKRLTRDSSLSDAANSGPLRSAAARNTARWSASLPGGNGSLGCLGVPRFDWGTRMLSGMLSGTGTGSGALSSDLNTAYFDLADADLQLELALDGQSGVEFKDAAFRWAGRSAAYTAPANILPAPLHEHARRYAAHPRCCLQSRSHCLHIVHVPDSFTIIPG